MLSMEPSDEISQGDADSICVSVKIVRTEEQTSLVQRFTTYVIEVSDFGRTHETHHRYGDFEALHKSIAVECPRVRLPPMPPKGLDGTDAAVIRTRKVELETILLTMLRMPDVLMERQLLLWKFLDLANPAVVATRFVDVPSSRPSTCKSLAKLVDPKYKDDIHRLGHNSVTNVLLEGLAELSSGCDDHHWVKQPGGSQAVCNLVAGAINASDAARAKLLHCNLIGKLLSILELDGDSLGDVRVALNVVVNREPDQIGSIFAAYLRQAGTSQLARLCKKEACHEFLAKLLWLCWDGPVRAHFGHAGGSGLKILQELLRSNKTMCAIIGAVLLAGLVADGEFDADQDHRFEAARLVRDALSDMSVIEDPQLSKVLCGSDRSLVRLGGMLHDSDMAPLILGLMCAAKPPAPKLSRITGNLAALVSGKQAGDLPGGEKCRALAAELLLHAQDSGAETPTIQRNTNDLVANGADERKLQGFSGEKKSKATAAAADSDMQLEQCEGIAAHEECLDSALRKQFLDAVEKSHESVKNLTCNVSEAVVWLRNHSHELPMLYFQPFDEALVSYKIAQERLENETRFAEKMHHDIQSQLTEASAARPSSIDPAVFKDRLVAAEKVYADVKLKREAVEVAKIESQCKDSAAASARAEFQSASERVKNCSEQLYSLRLSKTEKETEATKLKHKARTPNLDAMKQQTQEAIDRNLEEAKQLQIVGQRVQQGDTDDLLPGETREQKIAMLTSKLAALKKQNQSLLNQKKEYDFDRDELESTAATLEAESVDLAAKADTHELKRQEAETNCADKLAASSKISQDAQEAASRLMTAESQLNLAETEGRRHLSILQPMMKEQHVGWQRLIAQQKKFDSDQATLSSKLKEVKSAASLQDDMKWSLVNATDRLIADLQELRLVLGNELPVNNEQNLPHTEQRAAADDVFEIPVRATGYAEPAEPAEPVLAARPDTKNHADSDLDVFLGEEPIQQQPPRSDSEPIFDL